MTTPQVVHLELHTRDSARAQAFFAGLCGWRPEVVEAGGGSYVALGMGAGVGGGIVECPAEPAMWLPYVQVADAARATERASRLGASVLLAPREGPHGWRSVIAAPSSGELAFWQPKRTRKRQ
jgi:predicted enzyme related to lactoylglutathione lyase